MEEVAYRGLTGCALLREQPNVALLSEYNLDRKLCRMPLFTRTTLPIERSDNCAHKCTDSRSRSRVDSRKESITLNAVSSALQAAVVSPLEHAPAVYLTPTTSRYYIQSPQTQAHNMADTCYLQICLPGLPYDGDIELMDADQVDRLPPTLRQQLFDIGNSHRISNLTLLAIKDGHEHHLRIHRTVQWIVQGERAPFLQHGILNLKRGDRWHMQYHRDLHSQDLSVVATESTHRVFRHRVELYIFAISNELPDLRAFLSREICSLKYPVYAEEICALLAQLAAADITTELQNFDPDLARFICERARFLRDKITALGDFLPTLQNFLSAEQRLLSLARLGHSADERAIQKASDVLYRSVFAKLGDVAAARALLGLSVDNLRTGGTVAPAVTITLEP